MSRKEIAKKEIKKKRIKAIESNDEVVEVFPYGLITGLSHTKPIFLFKDQDEKDFLPVWLDFTEIETIHQILQPQLTKNHPYHTHVKILEKLKAHILTCSFDKFDGYRLYANVIIKTESGNVQIQERAEDVVCLALASKARFYTTEGVLNACREIKDFDQLKDIESNLNDYQNSQKYLM